MISAVRRDIIERELEEKFIAASGPGGQNVNKVATAVQLRFNVARSEAFDEAQRSRIARVLGARLTDEGDILIFVQTHRSQPRNREEARERLYALLEKALHVQRKRVPTRPTLASKQRRLDGKSKRADIKRGRGKVGSE